MDDKERMNERMEAIWCTDSETGEQLLLDLKTGQELARKDRNGNILYVERP